MLIHRLIGNRTEQNVVRIISYELHDAAPIFIIIEMTDILSEIKHCSDRLGTFLGIPNFYFDWPIQNYLVLLYFNMLTVDNKIFSGVK